VDLVVLESHDSDPDAEVRGWIRHHMTAGLGGRHLTPREVARWVLRRDIPSTLVGRGLAEWPARVLTDAHYDLLWIGGNHAAVGADAADAACRIVDLDDLEYEKVAQRIDLVGGGLRALRRRLHLRIVASGWRRFQRRVARACDRVALCSAADVASFGEPNAFVLANTVDRPPAPAGDDFDPAAPSSLLCLGLNSYGPNADGVSWFAREVLPMVRERRPDVRLRVVGRGTSVRLGDHDGVDVVGEVDDVGPELARASALVVPIRYAGGTRVKIVEAFAHRVPVVSTTTGAAGIGATDGVEFLLGDTPGSLASACLRILGEPGLRRRLVDAAEEVFVERFETSVAEAVIQEEMDRCRATLATRR
jgi:glycosyltransferase involved in cell wall biosynthesis